MNILHIPRIKIHNANALSSPISIGFPAMTAWLGGTHKLLRELKETEYSYINFESMSVICHRIDLHTYKGPGDFNHSIIGTGNPLKRNGERSSFIQEARCDLMVSIIIKYNQVEIPDNDDFSETIKNLLIRLKFAGGDIINFKQPRILKISEKEKERKLIRRLMPGHCLIERRDLMIKEMELGKDSMDALFEYIKVTNKFDEKEGTWIKSKKEEGWFVPIATGFYGISDIGKVQNQRDFIKPHRFAESVITLGEFIMPYRIQDLDMMLWHYEADLKNNLYLCKQNKPFTIN